MEEPLKGGIAYVLNCTPCVRQYGILNNKWGAVHFVIGSFPLLLNIAAIGEMGDYIEVKKGR